MRASAFQRYFLPGFIFQSVVIAGGYGTGREIVQYFLMHGPLGGLLGMLLVSMVIWSVVSAASFEFARVFRSYDYRSFFRHLLGRGWVAFEITYLAMLVIVLAVIAAAAGEMWRETFGVPFYVGVLGIMGAVGFLVFRGSATIEKTLAGWSFVLYGVYLVLFVWCFTRFSDDIGRTLGTAEIGGGWFVGGVQYAAYNFGVLPAVLFVIRHIETRREAVTAGLLAGPIAMIPALLFYLAMVGQYPNILDRPVPANHLLELLGSRGFQVIFQIVLFGTLIETGTGMIHAVNERVAAMAQERGSQLQAYIRPLTALVLLLLGALIADRGLIALIARGYGTISWVFLVVFVIPVLTWGIWKIVHR